VKQLTHKVQLRSFLRTLLVLALSLCPLDAFAQKFPFQKFTSAQGLAQDNVSKIVRDKRGFLWFCTGDGLSRFDGSRFKNYTQEQGLPHRSVTDLLETAAGDYLVATSGGISILDPYGKPTRWNVITGQLDSVSGSAPLFRTFVPPEDPRVRTSKAINSLAEHTDGRVYAGTNHGLFRFVGEGGDRRFEQVEYSDWQGQVVVINALLEDTFGGLWIAASNGILRMDANGTIETIAGLGGNSLYQDRSGLVWVDSGGHDLGIRVYKVEGSKPVLQRVLTRLEGLNQNAFTNAVSEDATGRIFVGSDGILYQYDPEPGPGIPKFSEVARENIGNGAIDAGGALWFGTFGNGALKLPARNITSFRSDDKSSTRVIGSLYFDRAGNPTVVTDEPRLLRLIDGRLQSVAPLGLASRLWGETFLDVNAADGEWWFPTRKGIYRYPAVKDVSELSHTPPKKVYGVEDGLGAPEVFNLFEDSKGDIWATVANKIAIYRLDHATDTFSPVSDMPGISDSNGAVNSFGEDDGGNLWISFYFGGLGRFRNGAFRKFDAADGIPEGYISDFHSDREGRLWIATRSRGLFRVDDPSADSPVFTNISTRDGLLSNETTCLAEDGFGMLYAGTGHGLHRIDPRTGNIRIYNERDGLSGNYVYRCRESADGDIWFIASGVLTRLKPSPETPSAPPGVYVDGFYVNGTPRSLSDLGETELANVELDAGDNQIAISYFALSFGAGESLRYQYRIGDQEWSSPSTTNSVTFDLAPGEYNFLVRAVTSDGPGNEPAKVSFSIAYPIWQRWWFLLLAFLFVGGAIVALDRFRVAKTRQVQAALNKSRESESRFRTLADTASDAIITIEEDSTIVFVNQAVERVFGYAPEEIIGKKLTSLMPENMRGGHDAGLARYIRSATKNIEWTGVRLPGLRKDGEEVPLELSFGEFEREGKRYFTGIARDITERLRAEEEIRKAREDRMRELQKVRSRIATDLHDDIGSSLTQIAVLSEVARGQASHLHADSVATPLERIKNVSKELVSVMSDIVWAINPQKDHLIDLVQRMRRFGSDVLSGRGITFEFNAPQVEDSIELGANIRREVFAIFKESINNVVKYSEGSKVVTDFLVSSDKLELNIADDGKGFDMEVVLGENFRPEMGGNGLASIRRRVAELGGICDIRSRIGRGTEITLSVPLGTPRKVKDVRMKDEG
jgi:PAS domain S-box-containing protein